MELLHLEGPRAGDEVVARGEGHLPRHRHRQSVSSTRVNTRAQPVGSPWPVLRVHGLPQAATGPGFASSVGLALFAAHPQDEWWDFDIPADRYPSRSLKRAVKWFRDNW